MGLLHSIGMVLYLVTPRLVWSGLGVLPGRPPALSCTLMGGGSGVHRAPLLPPPQQGGPGTPPAAGRGCPWALAPRPGHSLQEEGPGHGLAPHVGPVEQRVQVGQQPVAQGEGLPHGSLRRLAEPVRLLRLQRGRGSTARSPPPSPLRRETQLRSHCRCGRVHSGTPGADPHPPGPRPYQAVEVVVVPHERVEGPQLGPADTQLLRRVAQEAAHIGPDQRHPQQVEDQDFWEGGSGWGSGCRSRSTWAVGRPPLWGAAQFGAAEPGRRCSHRPRPGGQYRAGPGVFHWRSQEPALRTAS